MSDKRDVYYGEQDRLERAVLEWEAYWRDKEAKAPKWRIEWFKGKRPTWACRQRPKVTRCVLVRKFEREVENG